MWGIGSETTTTNVLNAHLWSLRRKLASIGAPRAIRTIRGIGFTLHE
ncbi:winged helix-turn-helix domain-containing protein [Rhodococcus wratislaviensis]